MHTVFCALALWMLPASGLRAAVPASSDADFFQDISQIRIQPVQQAAQDIADHQVFDKFLRQITDGFGWYGQAEQQPGLDSADLAGIAIQGLKQGAYDAVVFGESHNDFKEQAAAAHIISGILGSGVRVGAFLQEASDVADKRDQAVGIFPATESLAQARVPILLMNNQYHPAPDVDRGLRAAGSKVLIAYSGTVHTSVRMRDYIIDTLHDPDLGWGQTWPGRPVIEQALQNRRRKPLIIAMADEEFVFSLLLGSVIKTASDNVALEQWRSNLA
ncbi:MAG: hypothetical protein WC881_07940, partial [Elusimicrobiota bacterium]